jgi:hypothetical protein
MGGITTGQGFVPSSEFDVYSHDGCDVLPQTFRVPRANFTATPLNDGRILVAGGYTNTLEIIEPDGFSSHVLKATLASIRSFHTATLLPDGRVLFVGGYVDQFAYNVRSNAAASFEIYNPARDVMEGRGSLKNPRAEHTATLLTDGRVLITGGYQDSRNLSVAEIIDPAKGTVNTLDSRLRTGRFGHSAQRLSDGRVLIAGGFAWSSTAKDGNVVYERAGLDSLEIFDPRTLTFSLVSDKLGKARGLMGTLLLADGRVLLVGGSSNGQLFDVSVAYPGKDTSDTSPYGAAMKTAQSAIEVFDPATMAVYSAGHLNMARSQLTLAPIDQDSFLAIGGFGSAESILSAELLVYKQ